MSYRTKFLSVLTTVYFGMFLGIAGSGEHQDRQKGRREGNHQQQQLQQRRNDSVQDQRRNQQLQRQRMDRRSNQQLQHQQQQRPQHDVRKERRDRRGESRNWHVRPNFRPAHVHDFHFRNRHSHMVVYITPARYRSWHHRHRYFYCVYFAMPVTTVCGVVYNDWLNPCWMCWLQDRPRYLAVWVYSHRYEMSVERYEALLRENEELREQLREMEERGDAVDPNYTPPGVDEDLVYSREYIERYRQR